MAEFVQRHLEELTSVFNNVKKDELMTKNEVKTMIERIRYMDYAVNKRTKRPQDYIKYAEYISEIIDLLHSRREEMDIDTKYDKIEKVLKEHASLLFRSCSHRFKTVECFKKEIEFLKKVKLYGQLSKAYTRLLQLHGNDPRLHEEAAIYEFEMNKSIENSRTLFQYALRRFDNDFILWLSFFKIEIKYVLWLLDRRQFLISKEGVVHDDNEVRVILENIEDAVFEFKIAELVLLEACEKLGEKKSDYLIECYKFVKSENEFSQKAADMIYERVMDTDDEELKKLINIIKETNGHITDYDLYETVYKENPTEELRKKLYTISKEQLNHSEEMVVLLAKERMINLLEASFANDTATLDDFEEYFELKKGQHVDKEIIQKALKLNNKNVLFWKLLLTINVEEFMENKNDEEAEKLMNLFDKAISTVDSNKSLPIWKLLIDFSVSYFPSKEVEIIFKRAINKTTGEIGQEIKMIRLQYIKKLYGNNSKEYKQEYRALTQKPPNSIDLHFDYINSLKENNANKKEIQQVFNTVVAEHGKELINVWIEYGKFALDNMPLEVSKIHQRATVGLSSELLDEFKIEWDNMIKNDASNF